MARRWRRQEDDTDVANLVVWSNTFEKNRRTVLGVSIVGVRGQVQSGAM